MNCDKAAPLVAAYADDELHGLERRWLEKHLRRCASCAARHAEVLALRQRLRAEVPHYAAPAGLRERIEASLGTVTAGRTSSTRRGSFPAWRLLPGGAQLRWLAGGALAGCAATLLAFVVGSTIVSYRSEHDLAALAVAAHVKAILDDRLIEVASSDQHTVKPWLSAHLDYSPPVRDLAADGFPLVGGRITELGGRATATLVYHYRKHTIDVYVRPGGRSAPPMQELRGFNVLHARAGDWEWLTVSDAEPEALERLMRALVQAPPTP